MDPDFVSAMVFLVAFGSFSLVGLRMFLKYRLERLKGGGGGAETKRLEEAVGQLRDEVYLLRNDLGDMHERIEFTERLMARGSQPPDRLPGS